MKITASIVIAIACASAYADGPPQVVLSNGTLEASVYLPDAQHGFYTANRFDWSGAFSSLTFSGHHFYGPWFDTVDPTVRDVSYVEDKIAVGPGSAMEGPVEEFQQPVGYDAAKPGQTFLKIGVGVLRKADDTPYQFAKKFEMVDPGTWTTQHDKSSVTFTQKVTDKTTGYAYVYTKTIRLVPHQPQMMITHHLRNVGTLPIASNVYDHNFLILDKTGVGPWYSIAVPYAITPTRAPKPEEAAISGQHAVYQHELVDKDRVAFGMQGFGTDAKDYDFRIENKKAMAGVRIQGDRPLSNASVWSIRSVLAVEPFIDISVAPGKDFTWKYTYTYFNLPATP